MSSSSSVWLCQSRSLRGRGRQFHREEGDVAPVVKGSMNDTGEEPLCPCRRFRKTARVMALSDEEEQFVFRVSICVEVISPTSAGHSGRMRCLLRTECARDGKIVPVCCTREVDSECPGVSKFRNLVSGDNLRSKADCAAPRAAAAAALKDAAHTS